MKIYKSLVFVFILVFFFSVNANAQKNYTAEADEAFEMNQYYDAVSMYKKAYSKVGRNKVEKKRILFQIAECYRLTNNVKKAEAAYKRVIKAKYPDPIALLYYADAMKMQEKYDLAIIEFKKYKQKVPDDPRGEMGVKSCELAQTWKDNPTRYEVLPDKRMNSREDDFSPTYSDKKYLAMVFTSTRDDAVGGGTDPNTGMSFSDIFQVTQDRKMNWSEPQLLDEEMINSEHNEGSCTFNYKANTIYFTRCIAEKKRKLGCEIFVASKRGRGWGEPEVLPLAPDSFTVGHPAISKDEKVLYFASDIDGGYGGKDIWVAKRSKKTKPFGKPKNLGSTINTAGDEMFPYLRTDDHLYFASNGHIGMGGLDIFFSIKEGGKWGEPINMQYPMNSASDDFGICFNLDKKQLQKSHADEMGFFTTNRKGGRGGDDIWSFLLPEIVFTLQGIVKDENTLQLLKDVKVTMVGSDQTQLETRTDNLGFYRFNKEQILKNTTYYLEFQKSGYFNNKGQETTVGIYKSTDLVLDMTLVPIPPDPIPLPEIRYKLAKWDLQDQYKDSLNGLIKTMNDNPTIVIELMSHTDARDTDEKNEILSSNRARSVVDYLIEEGIAADRMVAKGYGETKPRTLKNGYTYNYGEYSGVSFPKGVTLTEAYINTLRSTKEKEAAHQLNRRTEFRIIRDDYIPQGTNDTIYSVGGGNVQIAINPEDNIIDLISGVGADIFEVPCYLLDKSMAFAYEKDLDTMKVSLNVINDYLKAHKIDKTSFVEKDKAFEEDGTVIPGSIVVFRKMVIGPKEVRNIHAKVVKDLPYQLIMGEKDLNTFGNFYFYEEEGKLEFE
ncbi:MAG: OmpA family protein [Saprospiraceae bacterium]|nr:OmpA family protein [Saprospiraceae bacterium]